MTYTKDTYLEMIAKGITYNEMLKLNEEDFISLLSIRDEYNRKKLLEEMTEHEEQTGSFRKAAGEEISGAKQALIDVFNRNEGAEITQAFEKVKEALASNGEKEIDLIESAIFAKAASDHTKLGEKK